MTALSQSQPSTCHEVSTNTPRGSGWVEPVPIKTLTSSRMPIADPPATEAV
jgi:hypothetical protein